MDWVVQHGYPEAIPTERPDRFAIGGKPMSFDDVEKQTGDGDDTGIHLFGINFCARSCPPLRSAPYDGVNLNRQLAEQARAYLRDPRAVARVGDTLQVNDFLFHHREKFPPR